MIKTTAWVFGCLVLAIGALGFVPGVTSYDMLFGVFQVDAMHSILHLVTGILAIAVAQGRGTYVRLYFKAVGVVYALIAVLGFMLGSSVMGMAMNMPDHLIHITVAVFALYLGFVMRENSIAAPVAASAPASMAA